MSPPKLSIITVSFNSSEYIERNIESIRSQSYDGVEHLVIDAGSTDGTLDILEAYEPTYDLRWISEPDDGISNALNKGIEMSSGVWVGFQAADDYYLPGAFETVVSAIADNPDADIVYGDIIGVDESGEEVTRAFNIRPSRFVQRYWSLYANLQALFVDVSLFDDIDPFDENLRLAMDAELYWRLYDRDVTQVHVPEFLAAWRKDDESRTQRVRGDAREAEWEYIYGDYGKRYERLLGEANLTRIAKLLKALYLLRDGRFEAFRYNLLQRHS